jgi:hypothetical protein
MVLAQRCRRVLSTFSFVRNVCNHRGINLCTQRLASKPPTIPQSSGSSFAPTIRRAMASNRAEKNQHWSNPEARKSLVASLEVAAKCLEVIPKTIPARDRLSSSWNEQQYFRRATGIRDLKKWALLPKAETLDYLERELRRIFQLAAIGDWDGLPQADLPEGAPASWWRRAVMVIRSIIIAAIPPVAVIVFGKNFPESDIKNNVTGLAWLWALISLLTMLDPRFGEKLSAFKDLPSFLPFGGKSKER